MADLQDVPVTESERRGLSALAPLAGVSPTGLTPGGGKTGRPIAQANIQLELPEFDPKNLPEWAEEFAEFLLLTGQSHVDVATKCSLLKRSCKKKFSQKQVKQIVKTCSTWAEVLLRLEKTFPVYETDLSVRTHDAPPAKIKRKIVFSDLRNPPKNFTPLFGEVAKFRTLTKQRRTIESRRRRT